MGVSLKQIYDMNDRKVISAHSNEQKIVQRNKKIVQMNRKIVGCMV